MSARAEGPIRIAIACGGTGGHLFPGIAVANQLIERGCAVTLLISPKDVDQAAVRELTNMDIVTLPAVGLQRGKRIAFLRGFAKSYRAAGKLFKSQPPQVALAMGGFTGAAPVLAARRVGATTFLHESNSVPGRANRWLSRVVTQAFIGFPSAAGRLRARAVTVTGTPVRAEFRSADAAACRAALGLDPQRPVLLVMGGSQGASGINELVLKTLPLISGRLAGLQWLHLTGAADAAKTARAYAGMKVDAVVHPFFNRMELALGAATVTICRAGASSLAEIAAMRVPPVLVPYPAATDNHQFHNARAFEASGAARLLEQKNASPDNLANVLWDMFEKASVREQMQEALAHFHTPDAAGRIAELMLESVGVQVARPSPPVSSQRVIPDRSSQEPGDGANARQERRDEISRPGLRHGGKSVVKPQPQVAA